MLLGARTGTWAASGGGYTVKDGYNIRLNVQAGHTVSFSSSASITPTSGMTFDWDWGDGTIETGLTALPSSHTYANAGEYCINITDGIYTLGSSGWDTFWDSSTMSSVNSLIFKNLRNLYTIGNAAFFFSVNCTDLKFVDCENCENYFASDCLMEKIYCGATSVELPMGVLSFQLSNYGSEGFGLAESITLPSSCIGRINIRNAASLKDFTFPEGYNGEISYPWGSVSSGCTNLKTVHLPTTITRMAYTFFYDCPSLKTIYCPCLTPPLAKSADALTGGTTKNVEVVHIPSGTTAIYEANMADDGSAGWSQFAGKFVDDL